ncbi:hypothetical protein ACH4SK_11485 [Streptomyces inhibens]|uniref:hypothetical protein n=1 Tax=Streptomyces inhibens TaxID=2293571 RepID=UPI0037882F07
MTTEAEVAQALREVRDTAVAEARKYAEDAVQVVADPDAPSSYGGLLLQIRTAAVAKLWQGVYASPDPVTPGPRTDREQIAYALLRSTEARHMADEREAESQPNGDDVGDVLIHAVRQVEIKSYRQFVDAVESATALLLAEV